MATTSSEPAGNLATPPPGGRAQLAAASLPAHPNHNKLTGLPTETEGDDQASDPPEHVISFGLFRLLPARRLLLEGDRIVRIGGRALDILIALLERPGELVSKPELIAKVWPHAIVEEGNLKVHVAALRRALGDGQSGNRYISTITGRGYCFVAPVIRPADLSPTTAQHSAAEPLINLPEPLTRLIGIDGAISRVSAQLAHHRLVTLVGPGGIGKTSVAVATAAGLTDSYEHGVWFVDLTTISDPRTLSAAVGSAIRPDISSLLSFLSDKRMLLVLDNCEHVIEAAAALVFQAMRAAPGVQIMATSREPLSVDGEHLVHLRPMEIPLLSSALSAAEALKFPAIQLFVERAANILGEFRLRNADVPTVIDICRKLDGMPLAIEVAAASIDALGLRGVVSRLDHPLRLPATRRRTAAPRHRTLRAALDWSYRLLTEEEQRVLRRLSVFAGSFTMEAAAAVAANPTDTESQMVDQVVALVAKSLVAADGNVSDTCLRLLATTRAYAFERLSESGEVDAIARRQAQFSQHFPGTAPLLRVCGQTRANR
ncbi:Predicted ATPase [Rhizobiales bacterium GAS191]|nr:Predicted ATPase [Rhizobiales bacterium GAS191]